MKSYFDEKERYTEEGLAIDSEIANLLKPIFQRERKKGHSMRELDYIMSAAVQTLGLQELLWGKDDERTI